MTESKEIARAVRERYGEVARGERAGCGPSCREPAPEEAAAAVGYTPDELAVLPEGANLGLGCGNPTALASLREGEVVLDLGSGAGIDCFLAARKVGPGGRVIGVDMTPEMVERARENARKGGFDNVEFRLGEIENLPLADASVDVVISNCVITISRDKPRVFREAFRVLRPGGRLLVSDLLAGREAPEPLRSSAEAIAGCLPTLRAAYLGAIREAGFQDVEVVEETPYPAGLLEGPYARLLTEEAGISPEEIRAFAGSVVSAKVRARKPPA